MQLGREIACGRLGVHQQSSAFGQRHRCVKRQRLFAIQPMLAPGNYAVGVYRKMVSGTKELNLGWVWWTL